MSAWDTIAATVAAEFSDIPDLEQLTRVVVRLLLAAVLGGLLGSSANAGKAAGVRTHMLVALGSALFVLVPQQAGIEPADMSRVIQGLVAGVGFLCAGTILKARPATSKRAGPDHRGRPLDDGGHRHGLRARARDHGRAQHAAGAGHPVAGRPDPPACRPPRAAGTARRRDADGSAARINRGAFRHQSRAARR